MHRSDTVQLCLAEVQLVGRGGLVMDSDPFTAMQVWAALFFLLWDLLWAMILQYRNDPSLASLRQHQNL